MKKFFKFLILFPCLFSALCDPAEDECGFDDPEAYQVNVENVSEFYAQNETIWINAKTSSLVIDYCTETNEPEFVDDSELFLGGFFVLKLNQDLNTLNAEIIEDPIITYSIGEEFSYNSCSNSISFLPQLTNDNQFYEYRIGISISTPGDYCLVSSRSINFDLQTENNASVFDNYNTLNDEIKFESCGDIYTRYGTEGHYFLRVE